ncbi:hypothetical protein GCM10010484_45690 [Actinokineospora globicatena]
MSAALDADGRSVFVAPRRLACVACGHSAVWVPGGTVWGGPVDPHFRLPLWLRAWCCGGNTLWAFNESHVDLIEDYVVAPIRERRISPSGMSVLARLPVWMKTAGHRDEVLRAIGRLRASLDR